MAASFSLCNGTFSDTQKRLFSGFPLSTMSPQACPKCGIKTYPERAGTDWIPKMHKGPTLLNPVQYKTFTPPETQQP